MKALLRKTLLLTIAVNHALVGAGAGERVLFLGWDAHHESSDHDHHHPSHHHGSDVGAHPGHSHHGHSQSPWMPFLPFAVGLTPSHDHHHDHGCPHVHVRGVEGRVPVGGHWTAPAPLPSTLPPLAAVLVQIREVCPHVSPGLPRTPGPPTPARGTVRLLI